MCNDEPPISHLTKETGYLDLRIVRDGFRFFIKDREYDDMSAYTASEDQLRQFYKEIGAYLDTVDIERFRKVYCTIEDPSLTIFEYATDVFDDIHKATSWLLHQPSNLTMKEIETKLGQIKYGVYG